MASTEFPPLRLAWSVWGLGAALYLIGLYQRVAPGVMTTELMSEFALNAAALGNLSAFYFHSYVAIQVPTGLLADHWGPRRLLTLGAGVAGTLSGVINMGVMMGPMLLQPAIGWVLDLSWGGVQADGVRVYDMTAYRAGFSLMLGWLAFSLILILFTRETHCRQQV